MRKIVFPLLFLITSIGYSQGFLRTDKTEIINDNGPFLIKSIGTGNWMIQEGYMMQSTSAGVSTHSQFRNKLIETMGEEKTDIFYQEWLKHHFTKADLDSMKTWGFNSLRVALHYKWFTLPIEEETKSNKELSQTYIETGFTMMDSLLSWCSQNEMYLILDMHGAPGGQGKDANISDYDPAKPSLWESDDNKKKLELLWVKIAERYKDEPWLGGYDLINETNWAFDDKSSPNGCGCENNDPLWDLHQQLTKAVRKVDKKHIIYISGNCWGNNYESFEKHSLSKMNKNMVITFHKYWNYNHANTVEGWVKMRDQYQMPLWMSEAGENSNTWFSDCIELFENNNIGWSWWPVKKSRTNNIFKVKTPQAYYDLIKSWEIKQPLSAEETYKAVLAYVESHKTKNLEVGNDVIYAMLHQQNTDKTAPFKQHKIAQDILFADYDMGKNGFAYFDSVYADYHIDTGGDWMTWNDGHSYRNDGVDIDMWMNKPYVMAIETGEWLKYTIDVATEGEYDILISSAKNEKSGVLSLKVNEKEVKKTIDLSSSETPFDWKTTKTEKVHLQKGKNELIFLVKEGGMHLYSFKVIATLKQ